MSSCGDAGGLSGSGDGNGGGCDEGCGGGGGGGDIVRFPTTARYGFPRRLKSCCDRVFR